MQNEAKLNADGHELVDSTPMAPPLGYKKQPTMVDHIRNMVKSEMLRREVEKAGAETFEEADDFDIPDDPVDPTTPFEEIFDPPVDEKGKVTPAPSVKPSSTEPVPAAPVAPVEPPKPV